MSKSQYVKMYERRYRNYRRRGYSVLEAHCESLFDTITFYDLDSRIAELLRNDVAVTFAQRERESERAISARLAREGSRQVCVVHNFWRSAIEDEQDCPRCRDDERETS